MKDGVIRGGQGKPLPQITSLGWILSEFMHFKSILVM